jgi:hypothetical protein
MMEYPSAQLVLILGQKVNGVAIERAKPPHHICILLSFLLVSAS